MTNSKKPKAKLQENKKAKPKKQKTPPEKNPSTAYSRAYRLFGGKVGGQRSIFRDLDRNLQRAGMKITFKAYVSLTVLSTVAASVATAAAIPLLLFFLLMQPLLPSLLFGLGGGLIAATCALVACYSYPVYRADKHKRELDDELPFTAGYMAILASAGVPPEKIFHALSTLKQPLAASAEATDVVRHINLFGMDIISAVEKTASRTPSDRFRDILEGIISIMHGGGNLAAYLREKSKVQMKARRISLKKFADTLSILSEVYVIMLLTAPLLFVIMLSVMSVMGGNSLGAFSADMLLKLITYLAIPVCAIVFLIIVDAVSPRW